ncbi:MAG: hypothetical protein DCC57_23345 [Chloroflexi bacterium]|nr:MAG: hypothetical protein DCC57_23345 [Chloroflexota bacterium]
MDNLVMSLGAATSPDLVAAVERKYLDAQAEHDRLTQELDTICAGLADMDKIKALKDSYLQVLDEWDAMESDAKREILHIFVDKIVGTKIDKGVIDLAVSWTDTSFDHLRLPRVTSSGTVWLPQEIDLLLSLTARGATQVELAQAFPDRTWRSIYNKYTALTKAPLDLRKNHPIGRDETYHQYLNRVGQPSTNTKGSSPTC